MTIDNTPIGPQFVIPGTERIGNGELAQRRAAEPLRAKGWQKPCNHGIFGDSAEQIDLLDVITKA